MPRVFRQSRQLTRTRFSFLQRYYRLKNYQLVVNARVFYFDGIEI